LELSSLKAAKQRSTPRQDALAFLWLYIDAFVASLLSRTVSGQNTTAEEGLTWVQAIRARGLALLLSHLSATVRHVGLADSRKSFEIKASNKLTEKLEAHEIAMIFAVP
jgi:hypothetical protein